MVFLVICGPNVAWAESRWQSICQVIIRRVYYLYIQNIQYLNPFYHLLFYLLGLSYYHISICYSNFSWLWLPAIPLIPLIPTQCRTLLTRLLLKVKSYQVRRRQWHPTPVLLFGKPHGRRSLVGCSPWGRKESDNDWSDLAAAAAY